MSNKIKIGIDAKWYFDGPASGKMVVKNIVNILIRNNIDFKLYLFLDNRFKDIELDFDTNYVNKIHVWSKNNLLSNVFILPYYVRKYEIDIVLYQTFNSCFGRHKKIVYIHDLIYITHPNYYSLIEKIYLFPVKFLTRFSHHVITVSNYEKARFERLNFTKKKISVVYHGFDPVFKPKEYFDIDEINKVKQKYNLSEKYILYVGRINVRKNVPSLLKAFSLLKQKNIKLVLVGNKEWKTDDIEILKKKYKIVDDVIETGPLYGNELAIVYACATLFCFPSFEESFGLPPLEAMASGVPAVVSNSSSIPEICESAVTYIDSSNPLDIAQTFEYLLENQNVANAKRLQGLSRASNFSWEESIKQITKIFKTL